MMKVLILFRVYSKGRKYDTNKYTNVFEDMNVIFIHMESIQNFLIDLKVNGVEITPNINKLSKEGMYFSKFYPQISIGTSSDSEFTLSTGLLPNSLGTVFVNYYNRKYETMENAFKEKVIILLPCMLMMGNTGIERICIIL